VPRPSGRLSSINVELRKRFELFANFRPIRNLPHIPTRYPGVDLIVRAPEIPKDFTPASNTEVVPGVVESIKVITEKASARILGVSRSSMPARTSGKKVHRPSTKPHHEVVRWIVLACSRKCLKKRVCPRSPMANTRSTYTVHATGDERPYGSTTSC